MNSSIVICELFELPAALSDPCYSIQTRVFQGAFTRVEQRSRSRSLSHSVPNPGRGSC